ncbi:MAG: HYR domain-containing protein [Actinomycetota bacterium]
MSRKKFPWSALVALTAFVTVAMAPVAVADQFKSDGDILSGGLNASVTNCSISHNFTGEARIGFAGSTHFANGATVTISYTSLSPKITVTAGTLSLPNPWNSSSADRTRSISVHVDSGITSNIYQINGTATGNKAGGGTLTLTDSFNVGVNCPTNTAPTLNLPGDITVEAEGAGGATVSYTVTAADAEDNPDPTPSCSPASGSVFPLGTTTVNCSVTDSNGATTTGSFKIVVRDTTGPVLSLPSHITAEATGPSGAAVAFSASASDLVNGNLAVSCTPASGSMFALGTTTVNCSATDTAGNTSNGSFTITVKDTTAPDLGVPGDIVTEADGPGGSAVTFSTSASDLVDGTVGVSCTPASGSTFKLGDTTVSCSATDAAGNTANQSFKITVVDTTAPVIASHGDVTAEATSASGAAVSYTSPATSDAVDGAGTATCTPASGSTFQLGDTTVSCSATDAAGNTATSTTFKVTVQDTTAPTIDAHADVSVTATGQSGAVVNYTSPATHDAVDGNGTATCTQASGSTFPIGNTTVTCSATDLHGNTATGSFTVKVLYGQDGLGIRQPINIDNTSLFSRGRAVPVKFGLLNDEHNGFNTSGWTVTAGSVSCQQFDLVAAEAEAVPAVQPGGSIRYDSAADQYIYNADFRSKAVGTCWRVFVNFNDGTKLGSAIFKLTK